MKILKSVITLIVFTAIFAACKKSEVPLGGALYFKCKINDQAYIPDNCAGCLGVYLLNDTALLLRFSAGLQSIGMTILDSSGIKTKTYELNKIDGRRADFKNGILSTDRYFTDETHTGELKIIKIDKVNKIIQATFYFTAHSPSHPNPAIVSGGDFRLKYSER